MLQQEELRHNPPVNGEQNGLTRRSFIKIGATSLATIVLPKSLAGLTGCAPESSNIAVEALSPGTYVATTKSMKGDLTLETTIDESGITNIRIIECRDTPVISDTAIDELPFRIIENQNIEVDVVSGATLTSMSILAGVRDCLEQAGAFVSDFCKGSDSIAEKTELSEQDFDLVVIGSGFAGLSSAIAAARNGNVKVLVLEKAAFTGGSSRVCGGGIVAMNSLANEEVQQNCSREDYIDFMEYRSAPDMIETSLLNNIYDVAGNTFDYLYENGFPIDPSLWTFGHPEGRLITFWSKGHQDVPWETGIQGWADAVTDIATKLGIEIRVYSTVTDLVLENDAITGIRVEDKQSTYTINAKKVILATGGFTRNPELLKKYAPEYANVMTFCASGSDGDGFALTENLNIPIVGSGMVAHRGLDSNLGYYGPVGDLVLEAPVSVNADGVNLGIGGVFYSDSPKMLAEQPRGCAYGFFDSTSDLIDRLEDGISTDLVRKYESLEEAAQDMDIDTQGLIEASEIAGQVKAPFYGIVQKPCLLSSIPGLKVNENCQVVTGKGDAIQNLYATGMLMFGNVFSGGSPSSGSCVATSFYTGAIAGNHAVASIS
jgi:fumarate reductase flavoprotein subunit